jgi:hypothetical protein
MLQQRIVMQSAMKDAIFSVKEERDFYFSKLRAIEVRGARREGGGAYRGQELCKENELFPSAKAIRKMLLSSLPAFGAPKVAATPPP